MRECILFIKYNGDGFLSIAQDHLDNNLSPNQINDITEGLYETFMETPYDALLGYNKLMNAGWKPCNPNIPTNSDVYAYCLSKMVSNYTIKTTKQTTKIAKIELATKNKKTLKPAIIKARQEAWNKSIGKR